MTTVFVLKPTRWLHGWYSWLFFELFNTLLFLVWLLMNICTLVFVLSDPIERILKLFKSMLNPFQCIFPHPTVLSF